MKMRVDIDTKDHSENEVMWALARLGSHLDEEGFAGLPRDVYLRDGTVIGKIYEVIFECVHCGHQTELIPGTWCPECDSAYIEAKDTV